MDENEVSTKVSKSDNNLHENFCGEFYVRDCQFLPVFIIEYGKKYFKRHDTFLDYEILRLYVVCIFKLFKIQDISAN